MRLDEDDHMVLLQNKFPILYQPFVNSTKIFYISKENLGFDYQAFALQKHSLLKEPFDIL